MLLGLAKTKPVVINIDYIFLHAISVILSNLRQHWVVERLQVAFNGIRAKFLSVKVVFSIEDVQRDFLDGILNFFWTFAL